MQVLISGGTGFIGKRLHAALLARGDQLVIWSRTSHKNAPGVQYVTDLAQIEQTIDAVVNLAGAPIVDKRWSDARKALLRDSRIQTTRQLVQWMAQAEMRPSVLVSGSAIGYYGSQGDEALEETARVAPGFTHQLCADWEREAEAATELGVRVCQIRTGVVLGPNGGALAKMLPPFRLGLGGPIGTGQQWMSWIHLEDEVAAILWLLDHSELSGAFNLTAPNPARNAEFAKALGRSLKRPACLPMPGFVMKLMLGEASELLLEGQRVVPQKLLESGFRFRYPELDSALSAAVNG